MARDGDSCILSACAQVTGSRLHLRFERIKIYKRQSGRCHRDSAPIDKPIIITLYHSNEKIFLFCCFCLLNTGGRQMVYHVWFLLYFIFFFFFFLRLEFLDDTTENMYFCQNF